MASTQVSVWTDSKAAKAIPSRSLGKARRVEISVAALPDLSGRVRMRRVPGEHNLADHLTKAKSWHEIDKMIRGVAGRREVRQGHKRNQPGMEEVAGVRNDLEQQRFDARGAPKGRQSGISIRGAVAQTTAAAEGAEGAAAASLCGTEVIILMVRLHAAGKIITLFKFRPREVMTTFKIIGFTVEPLERENIYCTVRDSAPTFTCTNSAWSSRSRSRKPRKRFQSDAQVDHRGREE